MTNDGHYETVQTRDEGISNLEEMIQIAGETFLTVLKTACNHPRRLSKAQTAQAAHNSLKISPGAAFLSLEVCKGYLRHQEPELEQIHTYSEQTLRAHLIRTSVRYLWL